MLALNKSCKGFSNTDRVKPLDQFAINIQLKQAMESMIILFHYPRDEHKT